MNESSLNSLGQECRKLSAFNYSTHNAVDSTPYSAWLVDHYCWFAFTLRPRCCVTLNDSSLILRGRKAARPEDEDTRVGSSKEPATTCEATDRGNPEGRSGSRLCETLQKWPDTGILLSGTLTEACMFLPLAECRFEPSRTIAAGFHSSCDLRGAVIAPAHVDVLQCDGNQWLLTTSSSHLCYTHC